MKELKEEKKKNDFYQKEKDGKVNTSSWFPDCLKQE